MFDICVAQFWLPVAHLLSERPSISCCFDLVSQPGYKSVNIVKTVSHVNIYYIWFSPSHEFYRFKNLGPHYIGTTKEGRTFKYRDNPGLMLITKYGVAFMPGHKACNKLLPPANEVCEGYVFTGVCLSTGWRAWRGCMAGACMAGGACVVGGMCGRGACVAGGHAWQGGMHCMAGACMAGGHAWQGAYMAGGMHAEGACMAGGMHGGGHVWQRGMCGRAACGGHVWQGACMAGGVHGWGECVAGGGRVW